MEQEHETGNAPVERIRDGVDSVAVWAQALNEDVLEVEELTFEQASAYLAKLRGAIRLLRDSEAAFEAWMAEIWKDQGYDQPVPVGGVGGIEVKWGADRKEWDHAGLAKAVLEALLSSMPGGEAPTPWQVRDELLEAAHVDYWRTKRLKALGIDPGDYCTRVPGRRSVIIHE